MEPLNNTNAHEPEEMAASISCHFVSFRGCSNVADAFEGSFATTATATAEHVAATAETAESIRQGMIAVRILDGIVKNKYAGDVGQTSCLGKRQPRRKSPEEINAANAINNTKFKTFFCRPTRSALVFLTFLDYSCRIFVPKKQITFSIDQDYERIYIYRECF